MKSKCKLCGVAGPRIIILTAIKMEARAILRTVGAAADVHAVGVGAIRVPDLAGARGVILHMGRQAVAA